MNNLKQRLNKHQHIFLIFAAFLVIYAFSLTFVYIEGDDASIIAYHLLGRDESLRPRYALYQAMFDRVLSLLPPSEPVLRVFAISLSALSAVIFTCLAANLAFRWSSINSQKKSIYTLLFLVLSPELFFSGLYINPSIIAFVFVFLAHHLVLRQDLEQSIGFYRKLGSALLFGFGVAFRWNAALYGIVIFLDVCLPKNISEYSKWGRKPTINWQPALTWIGMASLFSLLFVNFSVNNGFSATGLLSIVSIVIDYLIGESARYLSLITLARMISLFSPVLILLAGWGFVSLCVKKSWKIVLIFAAQSLSLIFFILAGLVKDSMIFLPIVWVLAIEGTETLLGQLKSRLTMPAIFFMAVLPWLIGVHVFSSTTLWGPGFEVRVPEVVSPILENQEIAYAPGVSFGLSTLSPELNAGFALASPEGSRPLGGYAYVLLGGRWREFHRALDQHLRDITQAGLASGRIIKLGAGSDARLVNKLLQNGFKDYSQIYHSDLEVGCIPSRSVTDWNGTTTVIYYAHDDTRLLDHNICACHPELCDQPIPLITNYTSELNTVYQQLSRENLLILSPFSGYIEINSSLNNLSSATRRCSSLSLNFFTESFPSITQ
jgi:hypothetical protein